MTLGDDDRYILFAFKRKRVRSFRTSFLFWCLRSERELTSLRGSPTAHLISPLYENIYFEPPPINLLPRTYTWQTKFCVVMYWPILFMAWSDNNSIYVVRKSVVKMKIFVSPTFGVEITKNKQTNKKHQICTTLKWNFFGNPSLTCLWILT